MVRGRRRAGAGRLLPGAAVLVMALGPAVADRPAPEHPRAAQQVRTHSVVAGNGECTFPMEKQIEGRPWALQRVVFERLWQRTKGKGVRIAVIDTGVDDRNPQLTGAVDTESGKDYLNKRGDGTHDTVGHGTKVAGIIAARPRTGTGFVGLAPESTIIPIRQNDEHGSGKAGTLAAAIRHAVAAEADIINISQDTREPVSDNSDLAVAVREALAEEVIVIASAGNDGAGGKRRRTYPASYPGVLAVAASDRNNERAPFSQSGDFVGVAAPGVDIVSTVPKGGQCVDHGTSFSAPYVAGVAALLRAEHPEWQAHQIVAHIQQTAERSINGRDDFIGWGVVDPVRALTDDARPVESPSPDPGPPRPRAPEPAPLTLAETTQERMERQAMYAMGGTGLALALIAGTAVVWRDVRRRGGWRHRGR